MAGIDVSGDGHPASASAPSGSHCEMQTRALLDRALQKCFSSSSIDMSHFHFRAELFTACFRAHIVPWHRIKLLAV